MAGCSGSKALETDALRYWCVLPILGFWNIDTVWRVQRIQNRLVPPMHENVKMNLPVFASLSHPVQEKYG